MEWNTQIINRNVKNKITVNFVLFYIKNHDFCETDVSRFNSFVYTGSISMYTKSITRIKTKGGAIIR